MNKKAVSAIVSTLLLVGMLTLAFSAQAVEESETIYIRADGSIDPPTAPIHRDGDLYTLTSTIPFDAWVDSGIVIERNNMTLDGAGYTIRTPWEPYALKYTKGIRLTGRSNVTIKNIEIRGFYWGIGLDLSSDITICGNSPVNNGNGIYLYNSHNNIISSNYIATNQDYNIDISYSSNNTITENNVTSKEYAGIRTRVGIRIEASSNDTITGNSITEIKESGITFRGASLNTVSQNNIASNRNGIQIFASSKNNLTGNDITNSEWHGIYLSGSSNNSISHNNITNNRYGITTVLEASSSKFFHNNFINNTQHVWIYTSGYTNFWDNGYPSGGNYWSDYPDLDLYCGPNQDIWGSDCIWDHPYVIDGNNQDNYPLVKPYVPGNLSVSIYTDKTAYHTGETMHLGLNITNPDSVKYLCFALLLEFPDSSIYPVIHQHSVILPIGLEYSDPSFREFSLPSLPSGTYTWHVAFLERATHTILVHDTAEWEFS